MPRNSSGVYSLPTGNPVVADTLIEADGWANPTLTDMSSEITNSLDRQGRGGMLAAFKVVDGNTTAPGLAFVAATNTGFMRDSAGIKAVIAGTATVTFGGVGTGVAMRGPLGVLQTNGNPALTFTPTTVGGMIAVPTVNAQGWRLQAGVPTCEFYEAGGTVRGEISCVAPGMNFYGSTVGFGFYKGLSGSSPVIVAALGDTGFSGVTAYATKTDAVQGLIGTKSAGTSYMAAEYRSGAASPGYLMQSTGIQGMCRTNGAGSWAAWLFYTDNSGNVTAAGNVTAFSDQRLKDVEMVFTGGLSMLRQMGAYRFTWKDIPENGVRAGQADIGLLAQQVRPWVPEAVVEDQTTMINGEPALTLNYSKMVIPLLSAVQELAAMSESADIRHDQELKKLRDHAEGIERRMQNLQEDLDTVLTRLHILEGRA